MRRWLARAAMLGLLVVAGAGLWSSSAVSTDGQAHAVAATLRCPTCVAESVADSTSPMASGMRAIIEEQLAEGRSPDQVRDWFEQRYGPSVLLEPPLRGLGWVLWAVPAAAVPFAAWFVLRDRADRPVRVIWSLTAVAGVAGAVMLVLTGSEGKTEPVSAEVKAHPVEVLEEAVQAEPGVVALRTALARALDENGRLEEAIEQYLAVTRLAPQEPSALYLAAFALVRDGRQAQAEPMLEQALSAAPEHAEALLLLASIRPADAPGAQELMQRFLEVAPDHPAAAEVKRRMKTETGR